MYKIMASLRLNIAKSLHVYCVFVYSFPGKLDTKKILWHSYILIIVGYWFS